MKKILEFIISSFLRLILLIRYRVTVKGLENLNPETLTKPGGVLFLPNHSSVFVDPVLVGLVIWDKYPIRPMVVEYMYYTPVINWIMKRMNALPIPNFVLTSNSLKRKKADKVLDEVIKGLQHGDNFLIYPAGRVKSTGHEAIGGASGVHRIIQSVPEANVILVRTTGLWGSSFSRAITGKSPPMFKTIFQGIKKALKNLIFFMPKREVIIEFAPAPADFPYQASRLELNRYLENWYNRPNELSPIAPNAEPGESLYLVSYSRWSEDLPVIKVSQAVEHDFDLAHIPEDIQKAIKHKLAEMLNISEDQIQPSLQLANDLGLDSLDNAEILTFLDDQYNVSGVPVNELTTVGKVMALAAKQIIFEQEVEEEATNVSKWKKDDGKRPVPSIPEGATLPEVFLNSCNRMGNAIACSDMMAGILTYSQAKTRVILLAEYIRSLPGDSIGILLPSSVAAYLTILACQLAGKVPVMINWTVGSRHLETVRALSNIQVVLSSWAFLDKLENVNLEGIDDLIFTLEDLRRNLSLGDKLKALYRSKKSTKSILATFEADKLTKDSHAVVLFTSGTESMPKGVPLTYENILSNQRDVPLCLDLQPTDILLSILPPFHAFGFTVSGLIPLVTGVKVAYYPDPTNGSGLAKAIECWSATIICGAPTFLKGIFRNASLEQLKTVRLCVTGAEKAPPELFLMVKQLPHCELIEGYGITECSPILTINRAADQRKGVGQPVPSVKLCIVDLETHRPLEQGKQGLILARGPNIFSGYLNKGLSSPFIFINGQPWYSTGDLGYLDEQGNLILSGRLKRFVKIGGEMVSLAAIEDVLQRTLGLNQGQEIEEGPTLAVCAREQEGNKPQIMVFTRFATTIDEVNRTLKEAGFSNLVKISQVKKVAEIPLMGTGKINYRSLETQLANLLNQTNNG